MRIVYLFLYQSIFQYDIITCYDTYKNVIKSLNIQQNTIFRTIS